MERVERWTKHLNWEGKERRQNVDEKEGKWQNNMRIEKEQILRRIKFQQFHHENELTRRMFNIPSSSLSSLSSFSSWLKVEREAKEFTLFFFLSTCFLYNMIVIMRKRGMSLVNSKSSPNGKRRKIEKVSVSKSLSSLSLSFLIHLTG